MWSFAASSVLVRLLDAKLRDVLLPPSVVLALPYGLCL